MGGANQSKNQTTKVIVIQPANITQQTQPRVIATTVNVKQSKVSSQVVPVVQAPFSFRSTVQCMTQSLLNVGPWIHRQKVQLNNSQFSKWYRQNRQNFKNQVQKPLCKLYNTIPEKFTDAKFQIIDPYTQNQRFTALNVICALTAISTISVTRQLNPMSRILRATRNVGFMYLIGGLLIVPEIYNPFIRS